MSLTKKSLRHTQSLEYRLVSEFLGPKAAAQYEEGDISHADLKATANAIKGISERYVDRDEAAAKVCIRALSDPEALAYALYYLPINAFKISHLLQLIGPPQNVPLKVLDFGCGPGTATVACSLYLSDQQIEFVLSDQDPAMLKAAQRVVTASDLMASSHTADFCSPSKLEQYGSFDIIFCANVLNEIPWQARVQILAQLGSKLRPDGRLIVLEPGSFAITRQLMQLRDHVAAHHPELSIMFPCLHHDECPMLQREPDNWCHSELSWERPPLVKQLDELTGFNKHRLKFAVLILQRTPRVGIREDSLVRLLTKPERTKRGLKLEVCGQNRYGELFLKKGEYSTELARARQYDVCEVLISGNNEQLEKIRKHPLRFSGTDVARRVRKINRN